MDKICISTHVTGKDVFGLVYPDEDAPYEIDHQVMGVACSRRNITGYWLPLTPPLKIEEDYEFDNLIDELSRANYCLNDNHRPIVEIWSDIDEKLDFEYEIVDGMVEGIMKIEVTNWKDKDYYSHNYDEFIGEDTVYMLYQNSD
jgi:hypothetical protein